MPERVKTIENTDTYARTWQLACTAFCSVMRSVEGEREDRVDVKRPDRLRMVFADPCGYLARVSTATKRQIVHCAAMRRGPSLAPVCPGGRCHYKGLTTYKGHHDCPHTTRSIARQSTSGLRR